MNVMVMVIVMVAAGTCSPVHDEADLETPLLLQRISQE